MAKYVATVLGCSSRAAKDGVAVDAQCLSAAATAVDEALLDAETKAGTECNGEGAPTRASADNIVADVNAAVPSPIADGCAAAERKAAGKFASALLKAHAKNIQVPDPVRLADTIEKARGKLAAAFDKAETKGTCAAGQDVAVQAAIETGVDAIVFCLSSDTVCNQVAEEVTSGGSVSTDDGSGATPADPVTTTVVSPNGGVVTISEVDEPTLPPPSGYSFLDFQIEIHAPDASAAAPLSFTFRLDATILPPDTSTVAISRNGVFIPPCTGSPGVASPDPCESDRSTLPDGDLQVLILTSRSSFYGGGVPTAPPACSIDGVWIWDYAGTGWTWIIEQTGSTVTFDGGVRIGPFTRSGSSLTGPGSETAMINATCDSIVWSNPPLLGSTTITFTPTMLPGPWDCSLTGRYEDDSSGFQWNVVEDPDGSVTAFRVPGFATPWSEYVVLGSSIQRTNGHLDIDGTDGQVYPGCGGFYAENTGDDYTVVPGAVCGDGVIDATEDCDDGNLDAGDGCDPQICETLAAAPYAMNCETCVTGIVGCGNGVVDAGEQCDDGNRRILDSCLPDCTFRCGNGVLDYYWSGPLNVSGMRVQEACDDGNNANGDGCNSGCTGP